MNMLRATTSLVKCQRYAFISLSRPIGLRSSPRMSMSMRFYSSQDGKQKNEKPSSILDEDMLNKAGFNDVEGNQNNAQNKSARSGTENPRRRKRLTSKEKQREKRANIFYLASFIGGLGGIAYLSRDWDSEEERKSLEGNNVPNGYSLGAAYGRLNLRLSSLFTFFSEPAFEKLLPPPAPEPYRRPLTLVLGLEDLLIHSSWDTKHGWRTAKRPGLDYFLAYLSTYYEIVIFSSSYAMFAEAPVNKLDPLHAYVSYALFREAARYKDGKIIKDLSLLDRDLTKTIVVDTNEESFSLQPDNAIKLEQWDGTPDDTLIRLIPFLEYLATQNVKDVRTVINSFSDKSKVIEEYAQREAVLRKKWEEDNKHLFHAAGRPNAGNALASLLGLPQNTMNKDPKFPLDVIREHGQLQYQHFQNYLKENAPKIIEEEQKLRDEFGKTSLNKLINEGTPNPEEIAKIQAERASNEKN